MNRLKSIVLGTAAFALLLTLSVDAQPAIPSPHASGKVHSVTHRIPIGPGQTLSVTEYFTHASLHRRPARAALFLTGPEFRGDFWAIPVEGYDGPQMAARRGFFAYTFDYVGVGESYLPADGSQINYLTQAETTRKLVDYIRRSRHVRKVDLIGEGYGVEVASVLADEPWRIRSVTMTVIVYKNFDPAVLPFFSPQLEAFLRNSPNGYWQPNFLAQTLAHTPIQEVSDYVLATQLGTYPTGPWLQIFDFPLPVIDAPAAAVPGLVIIGDQDPFPAPGDSAELAADWGGGASLVTIAGSFHVPRIEAPDIADQYFEALFDFIDP